MINLTKTCVIIVLLLIPAINIHAWLIPDTGQTKCYNNTAEIPCPSPGQPFYGQDGNYSINPPSYTKLDASGNALADDATTWTMIRDNVTGLIWENKTSDGTIHDGTKIFTWCDTNPATNGDNQGTCGAGTGAAATDSEAFIKALNDIKFGGFNDWRVPNVKELVSIMDLSEFRQGEGGTIDPAWFPSTASSWSSTPTADDDTTAWNVSFSAGYVDYFYRFKSNAYAVRAVRGEQSVNLVINGDGTVKDMDSGLMWQQGVAPSPMHWEAALEYAEGLTLAGYTDWRLPTLKELQSIVDYSHSTPAIDTAVFPDAVSSFYWSSTTDVYITGSFALLVEFGHGSVDGTLKNIAYAVRAVRQMIPIIQVTPPSLNFNYVPVGSTKDLTLTVRNTGGGTLTGDSTTSIPFSIVSGGSYTLGPGQNHVVTIRYQPTTQGPHTGTVVFTGGDVATVQVTGKTEKPHGLPWLLLLLGN